MIPVKVSEGGVLPDPYQVLGGYLRDRGWSGFIWSVALPQPAGEGSTVLQQVVSPSAEQLMQTYRSSRFDRFDPVMREVHRQMAPVYWTVGEFMDAPDTRLRELFGVVGQQGFRSGISVPCVSLGKISATMVVLSREDDLGFDQICGEVQQILFISNAVKEAMCRNVAPEPAESPLTPRELECLQWVARGKTSWETAQILEISPRTVEFHLTNAMQKLNCATRNQAIYEATRRHLLPINEAF